MVVRAHKALVRKHVHNAANSRFNITSGSFCLYARTMPVIVRPTHIEDAPGVGALIQQFAAYLRGLGDDGPLEFSEAAFIRDGFGEHPAFSGLVAEADGVIQGYLLYHFGYNADNAARNLHVIDLYVNESARGLGIGKALMLEAARIAKSAGATEVFWAVFDRNDVALGFYQAIGARFTKDLVFMKLDLT